MIYTTRCNRAAAGKEIFLVAINLEKIGEGTLEEKLVTLIHEINADNHLKDKLKGIESKNIYNGHIKYFDLDKDLSGLTEKQMKEGKSPRTEDVSPDSKAGKDIKEIREAIKKSENKKKKKGT